MNIKEAKQEIKNSIRAYLKKDENGEYAIPSVRQRPLLLIGPPGIGKTQIMEQIADELGINLISYTITHHTRQSAVGLPMIKEEEFDGEKYSVTEYTMSEIIASVYRKQKETGIKEGILFIDEINCVSETLAPTMLQFLQCKTFGNVKVPDGVIIVAAGNPAGYNKSVKEFDMVTLDRVRYMEIKPEYEAWKFYAREKNIYPAILSFLELYPKKFYLVEPDVDGLFYVTARGWEDLSNIISVYEGLEVPVTEGIIFEYIHHKDVAEDFAAYYDLFKKYENDYEISDILAGEASPEIFERIYKAAFDERVSVVELIISAIMNEIIATNKQKSSVDEFYAQAKNTEVSFETRQELIAMVENLEAMEERTSKHLENIFAFLKDAFEEGPEITIFMTEISMNRQAVEFLSENPSDSYQKYYEKLMIGTNRQKILAKLDR